MSAKAKVQERLSCIEIDINQRSDAGMRQSLLGSTINEIAGEQELFEHLLGVVQSQKTRPTLVPKQTELSNAIDQCQVRNQKLRPKLVGVIPGRTGFIKFFGDSNPTFQIETETNQGLWKIQRSYSDFTFLRQFLLQQHPDTIVPALPLISKNKSYDNLKYLNKIGNQIISFLCHCFSAPSLKQNSLLCRFVQDELPFAHFKESYLKAPQPRNLNQITTPTGEVTTEASQEAQEFLPRAEQYIKEQEHLTQSLRQITKRVYQKSKEMAILQEQSSVILDKLSALNYAYIKDSNNLYSMLSKANSELADKTLVIGATINEFFNKELKYQGAVEPQAVRTYLDLVQTTSQLFNQANGRLEKEKARLFVMGYNPQWQVGSDFDQTRQYDRDYCYSCMLPEATFAAQNLHDELEFFTETLWREVRRLSRDKSQSQQQQLKQIKLIN